jgi:hypothetical protein
MSTNGEDDTRQLLLDELRTTEENALYTSQAHFVLASRMSWKVRAVIVAASVISAIAGLLVAVGCPTWIGAFATVAGCMTAVISAFDVSRGAAAHESAAKLLTFVRQEARGLRETHASGMETAALATEVRRIADKYNTLNLGFPATTNSAFEAARNRIQTGRFEADFRMPAPAVPPSLPKGSPK